MNDPLLKITPDDFEANRHGRLSVAIFGVAGVVLPGVAGLVAGALGARSNFGAALAPERPYHMHVTGGANPDVVGIEPA